MLLSESYGIAIDLGTTTIAAALVEIPGGRVLARSGALNPQRIFGADVVSRLGYAENSAAHLRELQWLVNGELERLTKELAAAAGIEETRISRISIAGNPAMNHFLLGLPVDTLTRPPYRPRQTAAVLTESGNLGWRLQLPVYIFPSPGGFVGGDTIAFLYGLQRDFSVAVGKDPELLLDLGTNGEIVLAAGGRLFATSAAAGPAFEGGNLSCGMAALAGAIDRVSAEEGRLIWRTTDGTIPGGICGSGVLDSVALLLREGLMAPSGQLLHPGASPSLLANRLQEVGGELHFVLYRDAGRLISLSQADIRQVQLAKGAVRGGVEVLLDKAGCSWADIASVILTGSFGASLRPESIKSIGLLPENMVHDPVFVKEGALAGSIRHIIEPGADEQVVSLVGRMKIVPLSGTPLFEQQFMRNIDFTAHV